MQQDIENLMKPRVICIGHGEYHYPDSPFKIGDILEEKELGAVVNPFYKSGMFGFPSHPSVYNPENYPHLFRRLSWWEERGLDEMKIVQFVKVIKYGGYWREGDIVPAVLKIEDLKPTGYVLKYNHFQPVYELEPANRP